MSSYYVRKTGSDSNAGTSAGAAWLTIDKAANSVAAGDTVYVGAGVYRELVTMDTSGSSGNQISFIADVTGANTGDAGLVIVTSFDYEDSTQITRTYCWNMNGKTFITVRGFVMQASTSCIHDAQLTGNRAYEGVIIEDCALSSPGWTVDLDLNTGATPTADGLTIQNCKISQILIRHDLNASAHTNVKVFIVNVEIHKYLNTSSGNQDNGIWFYSGGSGTFSVGGITIANCTILGGSYGIRLEDIRNTTNVTKIVNVKAYVINSCVIMPSGVVAAVECYAAAQMTNGSANSGVTDIGQFNTTRIMELFGGFGDFPLHRYFGWSPFLPGEPIKANGYTSGTLGYGQSVTYLPTTDVYGNPRGLGLPNHWNKYYFDAHDNAVTDPNNAWTSESNIFDSSTATSGFTSTVGSSSSNYTFAGGTNAPGSGGTITGVYVRIFGNASARTLGYAVYPDGLGESLLNTTFAFTSTTTIYTPWVVLSTPSGGWTWAKVQALETKLWMVTGGSGSVTVNQVQLAVATDAGHSDLGAVEERNRPVQNVSTTHNEPYSAEFNGAGFHEDLAAADNGVSTTISVWVRWDSNYSGTKPQLKVIGISGVADQTDTATGSADAWEELSVSFTPTADGVVRVRMISNDVSTSGKCYFADLGTTLA